MNIIISKKKLKRYVPYFFINCYRQLRFAVQMYRHEKEIDKRRKHSIFEYNILAADMPYITREKYQNGFYGLDKIIRKYAKIDKTTIIDGFIEHGLYVDNSINPEEIGGNNLWTLGEERRKYLGKYMDIRHVHAVGPYILYADDYHDDETLRQIKNKLGRVLLVFPTHSTHWIDVNFNTTEFIKEIHRVRIEKDFDTVLVCVYWKDILNGVAVEYEKQGFKVCTAGHIFDENFMPRLKSIIKLSDMCMGNRLGTHVGYCVALGKGYYSFSMNTDYDFHGEECTYDLHEDYEYKKELEKLLDVNFGSYHEDITEENREFIRKYWGECSCVLL